MAVPYAVAYYFPTGILGVGRTALLAAFMSGMAGNVTAFNTVWTYDIYRPYINRNATDRHDLNVGRIATVAGVLLSIGTAYLSLGFASIIDYVQVLHGLFLAPLFGTFVLGMFWRRTTGWGGFTGLVAGTATGRTSARESHRGLCRFELTCVRLADRFVPIVGSDPPVRVGTSRGEGGKGAWTEDGSRVVG
jgi:Na+/proline symporter